MPHAPSPMVEPIRTASRELVRALGFTGASFAGTALPPSAVHALIEIETGGVTARALGERLRLEKSSVSRMLRKLVTLRLVQEGRDEGDGRVKRLSLTPDGQARVAEIHAFAQAQVSGALGRLRPDQAGTVLDGLRLYTAALGQAAPPQPVEIVQGYRTGLIAQVTRMHARYYARVAGFRQRFESVVAGGLAEFCNRLGSPRNGIWMAVQQEKILGSVAIDGEDLGQGRAHLRWFIVEDGLRGGGVGRRLLQAALGFVDAQGFGETELWTFGGLVAARHLYEDFGFVLAEERPGAQWGSEVLEQRFIRRTP
ncbi:MarR family winged helix-turn-helix transcriptional regulator [Pseudoroseomonas cervicalis]|uniref:MarR family winged helix-turn-helix transcriptional regulator n=1 Tax=Teichococcus cervicalis TaxID=204525 RepID=UPI00277DF901|nr:MarR family winged helix-turn-helix transcriptional regulator [Pseudoroseomonas cervicalis]MDQ1077841.1 DNA-binding MarR family transcriptional regulator/GNAT superfamily N-acetyltransferase [Pseudoroseomonas cervicalis]